MGQALKKQLQHDKMMPFILGVGLTLLIAVVAKLISGFPFLSIMGQLVIAIVIGIVWRATIGVPDRLLSGVSFSSKRLLRMGIVFLGMRLNLADIYHAGWGVFTIALIQISFALCVVYGLARWMGVEKKLGILTACGVAICGAAAVVAISPQVRANDDETAVGAATVAVLGTIFTLVYTFLHPFMNLSAKGYGVFSGSTLHEVAHVIAAASAGGPSAVDIAVIVKLTRVALLVPVALLIGFLVQKNEKGSQKGTFSWSMIPWFILGFLAMSGFNTLGIVSDQIAGSIVDLAYLLIAMAMAGIGLHVHIKTFEQLGLKSFAAGLIGSVLLSGLGYALTFIFRLN